MTKTALLEEFSSSTDLMPAQFQRIWHHRATLRPEAELQVAMLVQAIEDLRRPRHNRENERLHHEARQWVKSNDERWPFSFLNVCACFDLDPAALRRTLLGKREEVRDQAPAQHWC